MKCYVVAMGMVVAGHAAPSVPAEIVHDLQCKGAFVWAVVNVGGLDSALEQGRVKSLPSVPGKGGEVEVNYLLPDRESSIGVEGLLFSAHHTGEIASVSCGLRPAWGSEGAMLQSMNTHYRLHLGCGSIQWAAVIAATPSLGVRPFVAVRFASLRQKYFLDEQICGELPAVLWRTKNKYWGVGPELGATAHWEWSKWIGLQVGAACAVLYGPFYVHEGRRVQLGEKQLRLFNQWWRDTVMMKMEMGLSWYPASVSFPFTVELGGDQWIFFAQNQLTRQAQGALFANQGDISLIGGYLRLSYQW